MLEKSYFSYSPEGKHRIVYYEYGSENARTVICVHGLARYGRDFEYLAQDLAQNGFSVIAPDMVGRGKSDRFDHKENYSYEQYKKDIKSLWNHLSIESVDWIGTSMGGILGMMLAAEDNTPITKMIINDVGPYIPVAGLERIRKYLTSRVYTYKNWETFYTSFKKSMAPFGIRKEEDYHFLADISSIRHKDGSVSFNYDSSVAHSITDVEEIKPMDMWDLWERIHCPVLVIRGEESDILLQETMNRMTQKDNAQSITIEKTGHAPMLMEKEQISQARNFLLSI